MVNNKGFIRTLEAVIAIILILVFILYVTPRVPIIVGKVPETVRESQTFILDKILMDKDLRDCIIGTNAGQLCSAATCWDELESLINDNKPFGYDYHCEICGSSPQCTNLPIEAEKKSIYTHTVFIYENGERIVRLYYWRS